jgi:hypothetical protein
MFTLINQIQILSAKFTFLQGESDNLSGGLRQVLIVRSSNSSEWIGEAKTKWSVEPVKKVRGVRTAGITLPFTFLLKKRIRKGSIFRGNYCPKNRGLTVLLNIELPKLKKQRLKAWRRQENRITSAQLCADFEERY